MKQLKLIRLISIMIIIIFILFLISHAILCMKTSYPHPMLGIDANRWQDQFFTDLKFILIIFALPLLFDIVTLIISSLKIKKLKASTKASKPKVERKEA